MSQNLSLRRLGRPRLLIVGCGDVGTRCLRILSSRFRVFAVTSQPGRRDALRADGAVPLVADLDRPATLARLGSLAARVLDLAPPPSCGADDPRTRSLLRALRRTRWRTGLAAQRARAARESSILPDRTPSGPYSAARVAGGPAPRWRQPSPPRVFVYASTSGVYGDRGGARVVESDPVRPQSARARRRVAAEGAVRRFGRDAGWRTGIVRIPGIYAEGRLPLERLARGTPALARTDDVFTNHIHADDLARTMIAALFRGKPQRVVHASDDSELRMGDYFDLVADRSGMARPPRLARAEIEAAVTPALLSFMNESRRLDNRRLKRELRLRLRYPTVASFLDR